MRSAYSHAQLSVLEIARSYGRNAIQFIAGIRTRNAIASTHQYVLHTQIIYN
jgi:hypothetical protein